MTSRTVIFVVMLFTITTALFSEDFEFVAIRRTMLYSTTGPGFFDPSRDALFEIEAGTRVRYLQGRNIRQVMRRDTNGFSMINRTFEYNGRRYLINTADLIPSNTIDTFNPALICDLNSDDRKTWVPWYFPAVLQSMERDTVLLFDRYWSEVYDPHSPGFYRRREWYESFFSLFVHPDNEIFFYLFPRPFNTLHISNAALVYNTSIGFIIKNIQRISNGYIVTVKFDRVNWHEVRMIDDLNWDMVFGKEFFDMILQIDGDYMDVFLVDTDQKFTSFVRVDKFFYRS